MRRASAAAAAGAAEDRTSIGSLRGSTLRYASFDESGENTAP
jgi:hypothetical protein